MRSQLSAGFSSILLSVKSFSNLGWFRLSWWPQPFQIPVCSHRRKEHRWREVGACVLLQCHVPYLQSSQHVLEMLLIDYSIADDVRLTDATTIQTSTGNDNKVVSDTKMF